MLQARDTFKHKGAPPPRSGGNPFSAGNGEARPRVSWDPNLRPNQPSLRPSSVSATTTLTDPSWEDQDDADYYEQPLFSGVTLAHTRPGCFTSLSGTAEVKGTLMGHRGSLHLYASTLAFLPRPRIVVPYRDIAYVLVQPSSPLTFSLEIDVKDNRNLTIKAIENKELRGLTEFFHLQGVSFNTTAAPAAGLSPLCVAALATPFPPSPPPHRYPNFADPDDLPNLTDQEGGGSLGEEDLSDPERTGHHLLDLRLSDQERGPLFQASPARTAPLPQHGEESEDEDDLPFLVLHSSDEEDYPRTAHDASANFAFHQTDGQENTPPLTLQAAQQPPPTPRPSTERIPLGTLSPVTLAAATSTVRSLSTTVATINLRDLHFGDPIPELPDSWASAACHPIDSDKVDLLGRRRDLVQNYLARHPDAQRTGSWFAL